ncbi:MAG TPA: histidine kinase [Opitutaceae bacterium]|nr:histidine kinase [Opitutaceae bacterium]
MRLLALSALVPVGLTLIYATQVRLSGKSWSEALSREIVFCGSWWLIGVLVFWLCTWLHREPSSRVRVVFGLMAGAIGVMLLQPALLLVCEVVAGQMHLPSTGQPLELPAAAKAWPTTFLNLFGFNLLIYGGVVVAWYAVTYYRDLQERRVEAAEMRGLLQQAQLQALRSQLNPHFLFNTLHSIAELVHEDPRLAEQMLLRLSELLRKALHSSGAQEVQLAEELDFVKSYLEIEQLRLGERLSVTWDIAPDSLTARVPSLLLQPLIENAIQHGIAASAQPGRLLIRARRDGDFFELQVHDNGAGLAANGSAGRSGIGLANTTDRLERLYGERQRLELINDHGLRVTVRLPFSPMPQKGADAV